MKEKITIEGQFRKGSPIKVYIDGVLLEPEEWQHITVRVAEEEIEQPTFSVGMRVEAKVDFFMNGAKLFTYEMIYRIANEDGGYFSLIDDNGYTRNFKKSEMSTYFTPYEKPKVGDRVWFIDAYAEYCTSEGTWGDYLAYNNLWNLGLAFKEKKQAEFARERLSKLF